MSALLDTRYDLFPRYGFCRLCTGITMSGEKPLPDGTGNFFIPEFSGAEKELRCLTPRYESLRNWLNSTRNELKSDSSRVGDVTGTKTDSMSKQAAPAGEV